MTKEKKQPEEAGIVVNKAVFTSALRALGVLIEVTGDNFETVRRSNLDRNSKDAILRLLGEQLQGIVTISNGFESSIVDGSFYGGTNNMLN